MATGAEPTEAEWLRAMAKSIHAAGLPGLAADLQPAQLEALAGALEGGGLLDGRDPGLGLGIAFGRPPYRCC